MLPTLSQPPRPVPLSLQVLNVINAGSLFGWVFFGFGMIFFWVFAGNADLSFLTFREPLERTTGTVTSVEATGASENKQRVSANYYQFSVAGRAIQGKSYSKELSLEPGAKVNVEYKADDPRQSRIEGTRRTLFGPWAAVVTIFPLVGVIFIIFCTLHGFRRNRILKNGIVTTGKLVSKVATNSSVNRQIVFELKFAFSTRDGRRGEAVSRTHLPQMLEDEADEPLMYDPDDPTQAFLLDELPSRPEVLDGQLQGRPLAAFGAALVPILALTVHGCVLWVKIVLARL
jgi:hypothetical protein